MSQLTLFDAAETVARALLSSVQCASRGAAPSEQMEDAIVAFAVAADRAYLNRLIDGTADLLSDETFPRMEPMFTKYAEGSEMFVLLERAADAFSNAVQDAAAWFLASCVIDDARRGWTEE